MKEIRLKENGITLVALVVTIIILLILSGIAISNLLGENGLINQAKLGKEKYAIFAKNSIISGIICKFLIFTNKYKVI